MGRWRHASRAARHVGRIASLLPVIALAACVPATRPDLPIALPASWPEQRAALQSSAGFAFEGRVAVAAGEEGFSAGLRWEQRGELAVIELNGPLGIGALRIESEGASLRVRNARGERLDGEAARQELERRLGFELPLAELRYWVLGVPAPRAAADETLAADAPRLAMLSQASWSVEYAAYRAAAGSALPAAELPARLTLRREPARVRLLIERWTRTR